MIGLGDNKDNILKFVFLIFVPHVVKGDSPFGFTSGRDFYLDGYVYSLLVKHVSGDYKVTFFSMEEFF